MDPKTSCGVAPFSTRQPTAPARIVAPPDMNGQGFRTQLLFGYRQDRRRAVFVLRSEPDHALRARLIEVGSRAAESVVLALFQAVAEPPFDIFQHRRKHRPPSCQGKRMGGF